MIFWSMITLASSSVVTWAGIPVTSWFFLMSKAVVERMQRARCSLMSATLYKILEKRQ